MTRISVIGTGYLGATHAACMASLGHQVLAFDVDSEKIKLLNSGKLPFYEPGLAELVQLGLASGSLKFTDSLKDTLTKSEIHFLCVGTPQADETGAADLSQVKKAIQEIAEILPSGATVIGKSTVPVGTAQWIDEYFKKNTAVKINLIWNPEFLREGFAVEDTLHPDRIVLGVSNKEDSEIALQVYKSAIDQGAPVVITDYATAELVKVAANAFLATKISFINAFADLCDATGANVNTLADAIGYDIRIGRKFLNAGIGFGGGCLPKDIRALQARASELGVSKQFEFLKNIDLINQERRNKIIKLSKKALQDLQNKKIAILGAAFKPNSDDIRDSPALEIALNLHALGAHVEVHDPVATLGIKKIHPELFTNTSIEAALKDADLVLHLTEWQEYREVDPKKLGTLVKTAEIIDGRNILNKEIWTEAGWKITYLGKPGS